MLYLLITWFQDSQAKSLETQDNFATVNAEKSGEGKEKGEEKNYLLLFFCCFFPPLHSYSHIKENGLGSALMQCEITQQCLKIKQQTFEFIYANLISESIWLKLAKQEAFIST